MAALIFAAITFLQPRSIAYGAFRKDCLRFFGY
jgi:hypothetical protein